MKINFYTKQSPETIRGINKRATLNPNTPADVISINKPAITQVKSITGIVTKNTSISQGQNTAVEWVIDNWRLSGDFHFEKYLDKEVTATGSVVEPLRMGGLNTFKVDDINIIENNIPENIIPDLPIAEEEIEAETETFSHSKRNRNFAIALTCVVIIIALIFIFKK